MTKGSAEAAINDLAAARESRQRSTFDEVLAIFTDAQYEVFLSDTGKPYVRFQVDDHFETWEINNPALGDWIGYTLYQRSHRSASEAVLARVRRHLTAEARHNGARHQVHLRIAQQGDCIYLDLCDDKWRATEITRSGFRIVDDPPVRFIRTPGMQSLPKPDLSGSVDELRPFLNIDNDQDWHLILMFLIAALKPTGPYPILLLLGPYGSAKSGVTKQLRGILDPSGVPLRGVPRKLDDLWASAANERILTFDNVSKIGRELSDDLCRVSTGGGTSAREHYTHGEQVLFQAERPIILNGISPSGIGADFLDRSVAVELPKLTRRTRRSETEVAKIYQAILPRVLGGLCNAVSAALRNQSKTEINADVRMLDAAIWVTAAEEELGLEKGTFIRAYRCNQMAIVRRSIDEDPVAIGIVELIRTDRLWQGTASGLLEELERFHVGPAPRDWPKAGNSLSRHLGEIEPLLDRVGIGLDIGKSGDRYIRIWKKPKLEKKKLRLRKPKLKPKKRQKKLRRVK